MSQYPTTENEKPPAAGDDQEVLMLIAQALAGLAFGQVQITVHNSQVVQIEKVQRIRLDARDRRSALFSKGGGI